MTQANDPWAAAAAPQATATREHSSAEQYGQPDTASSLASDYAPEPEQQSSLFGGTIETLPSLFTLAHAPGTKIRLTITARPKDVHSTCHPSQAPDRVSRLKQYWETDPSTGKRRPGLAPIDLRTGKPNDKVMNLVISGQTDGRDPQIEGDDGRRSWFISGSAKAPKGHRPGEPVASARLAVLDAIRMDGKITSDESMINRVLEVHRVRRTGPATTDPWLWQARFVG
jgi:hypothetical protein